MKTVNFTAFRQQASELVSAVEQGESLVILRHGKPVATLAPYTRQGARRPAWKRTGLQVPRRGASLAQALLEERER